MSTLPCSSSSSPSSAATAVAASVISTTAGGSCSGGSGAGGVAQRRRRGGSFLLVPILLVTVLCMISILQWQRQNEPLARSLERMFAAELALPSTSSSTSALSSSSSVLFDTIALEEYQLAIRDGTIQEQMQTPQSLLLKQQQQQKEQQRALFNVRTWHRKTAGGLNNADRILLAEYYRQADSVFEYGLGESTYIANHVGVPRYAGIDSDAAWVVLARTNVSSHFRFYFADIGPTGAWGYAESQLAKQVYQYQLAPLLSEQYPFDVYMVDGRWRLGCMLLSFLHAHARGADPQHTVVLLHDCFYEGQPGVRRSQDRPYYHKADHLLDLVKHSGGRLCAYKRKNTTTDQDLVDLWHREKDNEQ